MIWFCSLDRPTAELYEGRHRLQTGLSSADVSSLQGEIASPGSLKQKLDKIEEKLRLHQYFFTFLVTLGIALLVERCG